jgi:hypothetical protein
MAFYSFQLERISAQNIRSRTQDVDLISFGVLVNGRDQGHGTALTPVRPGAVLTGDEITQGAAVNGLPHTRARMSPDWVVGPLQIFDADEVAIVYTATNTSDSQIPTADQRAVDAWTIKLVDHYYSLLLGECVSGLGLEAVSEIVERLGGAVAQFVTDPVGTALGVRPEGPCNGTVFADSRVFSGAALAALQGTPVKETRWGVTIPTSTAELTQHYSDEATHDRSTCGDTAETDVTIAIKHYPFWSLRFWEGQHFGGGAGVRTQFPHGGYLTQLYGLRI